MQHSCLPALSSGERSSITERGNNIGWEQAQRIETRERLELSLGHIRNQPEHCRQTLPHHGFTITGLHLQNPPPSRTAEQRELP